MKDTRKNIKNELEEIGKFLKKENFKINQNSNYPINNSTIELTKEPDESHVKFNLKLKKPVKREDFTFEKLGFCETFSASLLKRGYIIPSRSIYSIKGKSFVDTKEILGELGEAYSINFRTDSLSYYKAIYKIENPHSTTFCLGSKYECDDTSYALGLINLSIENLNYHIYRHNFDKKNYLVLECLNKTSIENFKHDIDLTLKSIAFLTGNWYQNERFIFSYNSEEKTDGEIYYESLDNSIISNTELINPREFRSFMENSFNKEHTLTSALFPERYLSNIINAAKLNTEYERAIELLIEGKGINSVIIKCSTYFVALETIVGLIQKQNKSFFKPLKNERKFISLKEQFFDVLQNHSESLTETEFNLFEKKIIHMNNPTNKDTFLLAYELYNIDLPKRLKQVLSTRNKFLHGKTPFDETTIKSIIKDLNQYADRISLLVSILVLKYTGYKGHVKNYATYRLVVEEFYSETKFEKDMGQNDNVFYKI